MLGLKLRSGPAARGAVLSATPRVLWRERPRRFGGMLHVVVAMAALASPRCCAESPAGPAAPAGLTEAVYSYAFGKQYECVIPLEKLKRLPHWAKTAENPPVSARKSVRIATAVADRLIGKKEGVTRRATQISLRELEFSEEWVWCVRFEWLPNSGGTTGVSYLDVVVLLDGSAVEPRVSSEEEKKKR